MALSAHLETLHTKHAELDQKLQSELRNPLPDTLQIAHLKKQKLQLKDAIQQVEIQARIHV